MADEQVFVPLNMLTDEVVGPNIRVKLFTVWKRTYHNAPNVVASVEMVMMDQELITNHVLLSEQQAEKMEALKLAAQKEETNITTNITNLRDTLNNSFSGKSFVDKGDFSAMNGFSNQMSENLGRLSVLKNYYDQADELRIHILQKMLDVLKIRQRSMTLLSIHNYQKQLTSFNHQWDSIPI
ncbi:transcription factor TGA2.1-like [Rutidosis leptorrhynchoides]|uniref:transcription factor TGA2.1-like n=1 Tax=Rutidosis leptorrhynchoides TaxID=125765 RepID=UPI003A997F8A